VVINPDPKPTIKIFEDSQAACKVVAKRIAKLVHKRASGGRGAVPGLATDYNPIGVYDAARQLYRDDS